MNTVFELGGELVRWDIAHNLMRLIAEGSGEDEDVDMALRKYAASEYFRLLSKARPPASNPRARASSQRYCCQLGDR